MWHWLRRLRIARSIVIPDPLWGGVLVAYPFLAQRSPSDLERLRQITSRFLATKEFHGAHGLTITDNMAVAIASQACLPLLHLGSERHDALDWYDDFVSIVVHAGEVLAHREILDDSGVLHHYDEILAGEAMDSGPVMLSWHDVANASHDEGYNVVIHEFIHKIDLRDGLADGCPPLKAGFMGCTDARQARNHWLSTLHAAFNDFRDRLSLAERFGAAPPWLDPYGAESIDEFFAVAGEAYFVNRTRLMTNQPGLCPLFDAFFCPPDTHPELSSTGWDPPRRSGLG